MDNRSRCCSLSYFRFAARCSCNWLLHRRHSELGRPLDFDRRGMGCFNISWVVHDGQHTPYFPSFGHLQRRTLRYATLTEVAHLQVPSRTLPHGGRH